MRRHLRHHISKLQDRDAIRWAAEQIFEWSRLRRRCGTVARWGTSKFGESKSVSPHFEHISKWKVFWFFNCVPDDYDKQDYVQV